MKFHSGDTIHCPVCDAEHALFPAHDREDFPIYELLVYKCRGRIRFPTFEPDLGRLTSSKPEERRPPLAR